MIESRYPVPEGQAVRPAEPGVQPETRPREFQPETRPREFKTTAGVVAGGSAIETLAGAAAVVLTIIGLAGWYPALLLPIAAICVGAGLMLKGGALAARSHFLMREVSGESMTMAELGGGMSAELMGGAAGIVLGILALAGIAPSTLLSVAAIVFGGTLMFGTGAEAPLARLTAHPAVHPAVHAAARDMAYAAASSQFLVGAGAVVLGILALIGFVPQTLQLVAILAVGGAAFLSGAAASGRMASVFRSA